MEHAAASTMADVHDERRLPEARINHSIVLRWAFIDKAISGLGKLALAWATIVLLGGFSTLIKQKDFWFVTIITFLEATRLFSSAVDQEDTFILNAPEVVAALPEKIEAMEHGSWQRHRPSNPEQGTIVASFLTSRRCCSCRIFFAKILSTGFTFAQFAAGFTSIVLAALRLSRQDYVGPADQGSSDHKSIRGSLNLFYGLVLAQGLASFLADTMLAADYMQVRKLSMTYQLGSSGVQIIRRYMLDTYMKCSGGSVREAMNMDMVSFAMEMARSNSVADRLVGVRILDRILRVDKYRGLALMRLRASSDTVANLVSMLGLKANTREEENTRGHAANVVLWLSPDLLVESFPELLQMVSSMLTMKTTTAAVTITARVNPQSSSNVSIELTWLGVKILKKIMDNPDNCKKVMDDDDQLMSSIVDLTAVSDDSSSISWSPVVEEIIVEAVRVLHKLVRTTGDAGRALRCKTSENLHVIRNIRKILEHPQSHTELLTEAIGVLACLALDETGKQEIGSSPRIIRKLVSFLVAETQTPSNRVELAKSAVEALVMLGVDSPSIAWRILEELKPENVQQLVETLSSDSTELRTMVAKLLGSLRVNSKPEHAHYNRKIDSQLPLLLNVIKLEVEKVEALGSAGELHARNNLEEWRTKQGALLESIVGLSVQICKFIHASEYGDALRNANLAVDVFMQKLRRILDLYKSPETEFPGDLKVAFTNNYAGAMQRPGNRINLSQVKQQEGETLQSYLHCFFDKKATIMDVMERDVIDCFQNSLHDRRMFQDFGRRRPADVKSLKIMA
ncbi:uncharacterized protein LOC101774941 [Setaria italica]|uniref:uncharacterized protein LOC101774941 n=1 Tax=Setaria italica TaxID=4555 RepID=UPI000BE6060F|nr:uncharacterized protein LOC101774941 [Setaria italica]